MVAVLVVLGGMFIAGIALVSIIEKNSDEVDNASPSTDFVFMGKVCKVEQINWKPRTTTEKDSTTKKDRQICSDVYWCVLRVADSHLWARCRILYAVTTSRAVFYARNCIRKVLLSAMIHEILTCMMHQVHVSSVITVQSS